MLSLPESLRIATLRVESLAYTLVVVPLVALFPARIAYGIARMRGDVVYRLDVRTRRSFTRNLAELRGDLTPKQLDMVARDSFRIKSCETIDSMRLLGDGKALIRLLEIRGTDTLRTALAGGKGAIVFSAHFGSVRNGFSALGALGFPVTIVGRWSSTDDAERPIFSRTLHRLRHGRPVEYHFCRPTIVNKPGRSGTGIEVLNSLRNNEIVGILLDTKVQTGEFSRPFQVRFLGRQVRMALGAAAIAQFTGSPLMMMLVRRMADFRHQTAIITPPVSTSGSPAEVFARCLAMLEENMLNFPEHYIWAEVEGHAEVATS